MSPEGLHILQHSLGCDQYGRTSYRGEDEGDGCFEYARNRYVSSPNADLIELCRDGFLKDVGPIEAYGGQHLYMVTASGRDEMKRCSPVPPKMSRAQKRYRQYLKVADCFDSFGDFLKRA